MSNQALVADGAIFVYNPNTLSLEIWTGQISAGSVVIGAVTQGAAGVSSWLVAQDRVAVTVASGSAASAGNNTCITPASGKKVQVCYLSYNPSGAVEAAFRFGAAGTLFMRNSLAAGGAVVAKDFGEFRNVQGAADEPLVLNLSGAVATIWNAFYREVD